MEGDGQCMAYHSRLRALYSSVLSEPFLIQQRQQQGDERSTFTGMRITRLLYSSPMNALASHPSCTLQPQNDVLSSCTSAMLFAPARNYRQYCSGCAQCTFSRFL